MAILKRRKSPEHIRRRRSFKGGGRRCDTWRTRLAELQSKLEQKAKYKGLNRLGKQLQKLYLDIVTSFCNERYQETPVFEAKLDDVLNTLDHAFNEGQISHTDLTKTKLKITLVTSGASNALSKRLMKEISDPHTAYTDKDREKLLSKMVESLHNTHWHPVY